MHGILAKEEWVEVVTEEQQAGELYSIRYEEALALEAALQRRTCQRLMDKLLNLEDKLLN